MTVGGPDLLFQTMRDGAAALLRHDGRVKIDDEALTALAEGLDLEDVGRRVQRVPLPLKFDTSGSEINFITAGGWSLRHKVMPGLKVPLKESIVLVELRTALH
jgi:hypothetical protein